MPRSFQNILLPQKILVFHKKRLSWVTAEIQYVLRQKSEEEIYVSFAWLHYFLYSKFSLKRLCLQGPNFAFLHLNFVAFLFYISIFPIPLSYTFSSRRAITVQYLKAVFLTL